MKNSILLHVLFLSFLAISIVSCNDDDNDAPEPPVPQTPSYETTFNVTLNYTYKLRDTNTDQVLVDVNYGIADINTFIYVIHRESDGLYLKLQKLDSSSLKKITTDNIAAVKESLPEGKYYITFVALKDFVTKEADIPIILGGLTQKYSEAVMQLPNDYAHYTTTEFEVSAREAEEKNNTPIAVPLKKMTTDLIFEFTHANEVPNSSDYLLTVGVEKIPSVFFIATGQTLTASETLAREQYLYSGEKRVSLQTNEGDQSVVATFHTLTNNQLPAADRGKYWFEFKESNNGGQPIKAITQELDEITLDHSSSVYIYNLYEEEATNGQINQ